MPRAVMGRSMRPRAGVWWQTRRVPRLMRVARAQNAQRAGWWTVVTFDDPVRPRGHRPTGSTNDQRNCQTNRPCRTRPRSDEKKRLSA